MSHAISVKRSEGSSSRTTRTARPDARLKRSPNIERLASTAIANARFASSFARGSFGRSEIATYAWSLVGAASSSLAASAAFFAAALSSASGWYAQAVISLLRSGSAYSITRSPLGTKSRCESFRWSTSPCFSFDSS